jgi:hypothetical protein
MPTPDRLLKRLRKKAKRGMRGWPVATIAFYGPDLTRATKVAVGIIPSEDLEPSEMRDWQVETGDVRYRIPIGTLRDWEQRRHEPDQTALSYLKVIEEDPKRVARAVAA